MYNKDVSKRYQTQKIIFMEVLKMYEYVRGNYVYSGNRECGSPIREVKTVSEKEAKYWDNVEKQIRQQQKG